MATLNMTLTYGNDSGTGGFSGGVSYPYASQSVSPNGTLTDYPATAIKDSSQQPPPQIVVQLNYDGTPGVYTASVNYDLETGPEAYWGSFTYTGTVTATGGGGSSNPTTIHCGDSLTVTGSPVVMTFTATAGEVVTFAATGATLVIKDGTTVLATGVGTVSCTIPHDGTYTLTITR